MFRQVYYICLTYSGASASHGGKEDQAFAKERDTKRTQFDKKTGKAVTVSGPRDKPESVCIKTPY